MFQAVLGAALIAVAWWNPAGWLGAAALSGMYAAGASMILGGVAQMLAPKARTPRTQTTDNGKQNTYFSSLDNMVARAMFCLFCTVKCAWGRGWLLRRSARQTKGTVVRLW